MFIKLKRDIISIYYSGKFLMSFLKKEYANCLFIVAKIEFLESFISIYISNVLFSLLKNKYDPSSLNANDPYLRNVKQRFSEKGQQQFLMSNIIVLKPYISPVEKGVLLLNYTEIINAFPFLFDLKKIQERYHIVLEPSTESPFQMYYKYYMNSSAVFVQSLSEREKRQASRHNYISVPVCAGDWVHEGIFYPDPTAGPVIYDFCVIANFISVKRYPELLAALKTNWPQNLKFAIIASVHVGHNKAWIERLLENSGLAGAADIYMEISQKEINKILNISNCHVLYSLREGANRANFESLCTNTPVVVYKYHVGFPNWRFKYPHVVNFTDNSSTAEAIKTCKGIKDQNLLAAIPCIVGSKIATDVLNTHIRQYSIANNLNWEQEIFRKVNKVHTFYYYPEDAKKCIEDYRFLSTAIADQSIYDLEYVISRYSA